MHILVHVLPNTRFIDSEHFVNTINTCTTENFNCVFRETIKVEVIWFLHGILQLTCPTRMQSIRLQILVHNVTKQMWSAEKGANLNVSVAACCPGEQLDFVHVALTTDDLCIQFQVRSVDCTQ